MRLRPFASAFLRASASRSPLPAGAQEDTGPTTPTFKEGDVIGVDKIDTLKPFLPPEFWSNRDFFFYEGMKLEIGPVLPRLLAGRRVPGRDREVRGPGEDRSRREPRGLHRRPAVPDGQDRLQGRSAGRRRRSSGTSTTSGRATARNARYYYSYWDRGEELPLYYEGTAKTIQLSHRVEPEYLDRQAATCSAARSARTRSASRSTRRSTRAASSS